MMIVICDRLLDEVSGARCILGQRHEGECSATYPTDQRAGWPRNDDPRWHEIAPAR